MSKEVVLLVSILVLNVVGFCSIAYMLSHLAPMLVKIALELKRLELQLHIQNKKH